MPVSWKALGRTLEIITIVLLVVAVRYLWVKADSEGTAAPETSQVEIQAPEAKTEIFEPPYQPPVPTRAESSSYQPPVATLADTESYPQTVASTPPVVVASSHVRLAPYSCSSSPTPTESTNPSAGTPTNVIDVPVTPPTPVEITDSRPGSPTAVIEEFFALLDRALEGRRDEFTKDPQAFLALLDKLLLPRHDRRYTAQLVLARHWRTASDEERDRFISAFYCRTIQKIAEPLLAFEREQLSVLAFRGNAIKKRTTVKTVIRRDDGTKVAVNYGMVERESGWRMFDVTIDGISYVRTVKAELNTEIQRKGLGGVIARLEASTSTDDE